RRVKKVEHFKSMANQMATADEVVNDILDPNPEPSVSKDRMPVNKEHVLHKGRGMTPNTWFNYDHPEHGKIEVSAYHDGKQAHILGVGAGGGDPHVHPEEDAGLDKDLLRAMASHALKLGPGQHLKKTEYTA